MPVPPRCPECGSDQVSKGTGRDSRNWVCGKCGHEWWGGPSPRRSQPDA